MSELNHAEVAAAILSDAQRAQTIGQTVSGKLLALFKDCESLADFENVCKVAETDWKAKRAKAKADVTLPTCWTQAKSDIKGAVNAGVDVAACETVSQAKRLKVAANKAAKPVTASAKGAGKVVEAVVVESAQPAESPVGKAETLLNMLAQLSGPMRDAMLDSFIDQADKALQAAGVDTLGTEIAKLESHLKAAV